MDKVVAAAALGETVYLVTELGKIFTLTNDNIGRPSIELIGHINLMKTND